MAESGITTPAEDAPSAEGGANTGKPTRIGVLVVHGVGEQRRFGYLDGEVRTNTAVMQGGDEVTTALRDGR